MATADRPRVLFEPGRVRIGEGGSGGIRIGGGGSPPPGGTHGRGGGVGGGRGAGRGRGLRGESLSSVVAAFSAMASIRGQGQVPSPAPVAGWVLISSLTSSGASASFDFTSIPATYNELAIGLLLRSTRVATADQLALTLNGDGGANYAYVRSDMNGTTDALGGTTGTSALMTDNIPGASSTAGEFFVGDLVIPYYASAGARRLAYLTGGGFITGMVMNRAAVRWASTAAIARVTLSPLTGPNWESGSAAAMYGRL